MRELRSCVRVCVQACMLTCLAVCSPQCVLAASVLGGVLADSVWIPVGITAGDSTFLSLEAARPCLVSLGCSPCLLQLEVKARGRAGSPLLVLIPRVSVSHCQGLTWPVYGPCSGSSLSPLHLCSHDPQAWGLELHLLALG